MIKKIFIVSCLLITSLPALAYDPAFLKTNPLSMDMNTKGIYGTDNRQEYYQVQPTIRKISASVPALVDTNKLIPNGSGFTLKFAHHTSVYVNNVFYDLCPEDTFYNQPAASSCSGVVIDDNKIATAAHCVQSYQQGDACGEISFVFGYQLKGRNQPVTKFSKQDVFKCKKVIAKAYQGKTDYAVLEVDRVMDSHPPLPINGEDKIANNESVSVMGYPNGLPMKITGGATVRENAGNDFFTTDLDTFGGNSGSPVFNTASLINGEAKVEGLLVRGGTDYVPNPSNKTCYIANKCTIQDAQTKGCRGEEVTRISKVKSFAKFIYSRPAQKSLQITTRQKKVKLGEELKIDLNIPEAGYLNVIEVNPQGQYTLLFPNGYEKNNHVNAGSMTISDARAWRLEILSGPFGKHRLYAVFSKTPINLYQKKSIELQGQIQQFAPSSVNDLMSITRGAGAAPRELDNCNTRGAGATARCQDKPQLQSTQVCYYQNPNDCR